MMLTYVLKCICVCCRKIPACPENDLLKGTLSSRVYKAAQAATVEPTHRFPLHENKVVRTSIYSVRLERIPDVSIDWLELSAAQMCDLDGIECFISQEGSALVHEVRALILKARRLLEEIRDLHHNELDRFTTSFSPFLDEHQDLSDRMDTFMNAHRCYSIEKLRQANTARQSKPPLGKHFSVDPIISFILNIGTLLGLINNRLEQLITAESTGARDAPVPGHLSIEIDLALITSRLDDARHVAVALLESYADDNKSDLDQAELSAILAELNSLLQDYVRIQAIYHRHVEKVADPPDTLTIAFARFESSVTSARKALVALDAFKTAIDSSAPHGVLDDQFISHQPTDSRPPPAGTGSSASNNKASEIDKGEDGDEGPLYPPGSIVAHMTVEYTADEKIETTQADTGERTVTASRRKSLFTYTGCISGQVELDWQVTHIA